MNIELMKSKSKALNLIFITPERNSIYITSQRFPDLGMLQGKSIGILEGKIINKIFSS